MPDRRRPSEGREPSEPQRVQKVLADAGYGSRREIEGWIREGRVQINGQLAKLGDRAGDADRIRVDGRDFKRRPAHQAQFRVIAYNKPEGEIVTRRDPEGRPIVFRRLPKPESGRWIAVGRLDINTSGLLLFTNHGELANRLMHPSKQVEREYAVRVLGPVAPETFDRLVNGIELEDGPARFEEIVESGGSGVNQWFHVLLREGRNREVRRLWEAAGCTVNRLKRVRFGNVMLEDRLRTGQWRELTEQELRDLMALADLEMPARPKRKAGRPWISGPRSGPRKGNRERG